MLNFLKGLLASGEHAMQVVGVNGITAVALNHDTFLAALIAFIESETQALETTAHVAVQAPGPVESQGSDSNLHAMAAAQAAAVTNPVPTSEQIAAYLAMQSQSAEAVKSSTVVDAATGAPQGTFQASA